MHDFIRKIFNSSAKLININFNITIYSPILVNKLISIWSIYSYIHTVRIYGQAPTPAGVA